MLISDREAGIRFFSLMSALNSMKTLFMMMTEPIMYALLKTSSGFQQHFASVALHLAWEGGGKCFLCLSCVLVRLMSHTMPQRD